MQYTKEQLSEILKKHRAWRYGEAGGERANLCEANLYGANLRRADLRGANLYGANLCGANLRGANLCGANLCEANLRRADLCGANLCEANLRRADLRGADLCEANLCGANLRGANLRGADLCEANLRRADLYGANLCEANLCEADLYGANLCEANLNHCAGNNRQIKSLFISEKWAITYTAEYLQIGCQRHKFADWWCFDDATISKMDISALMFWREMKDFIKSTVERFPAVKTGKEQ